MKTVKRVRPILDMNNNITASVLGRAYVVANGLATKPALYAAPNPPVPTLQGQIKKLEDSEAVAATRAKGSAAARDVERITLVGMLETECAYVQTLCDANPGQAVAIAEGAGMVVARASTRVQPILEIKGTGVSGEVALQANVSALVEKPTRKTFFKWQWTTDGGATFHDAEPTAIGSTTIGGLPPLTTVGFRVAVSDRNGRGPWCPVVSVLVH